MSIEIIDNITTARELRDILNATPDYLLDVPITIGHDGHNLMFEASRVEVLDIIEDGARVQMIRVSGDGEMM